MIEEYVFLLYRYLIKYLIGLFDGMTHIYNIYIHINYII